MVVPQEMTGICVVANSGRKEFPSRSIRMQSEPWGRPAAGPTFGLGRNDGARAFGENWSSACRLLEDKLCSLSAFFR